MVPAPGCAERAAAAAAAQRQLCIGNRRKTQTHSLPHPPPAPACPPEFGFPGAGIDIGLAMFVVRLADGDLWLHTPIAPTEEALALLDSIGGRVAHVVCPNLSPEHWVFARAFSEHTPDARFWVCGGLLTGGGLPLPGRDGIVALTQTHAVQELRADDPSCAWAPEIGVALFREAGGLFEEAAFLVRRARAVIVADGAFAAHDKRAMPLPPFEALARAVGIHSQVGAPLLSLMAATSRPAVAAYARAVLAWDFTELWCSHLEPVIKDGRGEWARAFAPIMREGRGQQQ